MIRTASVETADIACKRRAFEPNKDKSERGAAGGCHWTGASSSIKKLDFWMVVRLMESGQKLAFMERLAQQPIDMSRKKCQKCLASETCGNQHIQFKTTQHFFEAAHDVEGGRTRAVCSWKKVKALENETSPSTLRFVQSQETSVDGRTLR